MIALERVRQASAIPATFRGVKQQERDLALLKWQLDLNHADLKSSQWKGSKRQLSLESKGKCAYCEAPASAVAHCDVEHFRPKSVYWWLALCYDNYLFACQICNQVYKGDQFPIYGTRLVEPPLAATMNEAQLKALVGTFAPDPLDTAKLTPFLALWDAEQPGLLNPYFIDPEPFFSYEVDTTLEEVRIRPSSAASLTQRRCADDCLTLYGLNREELKRQRFLNYQVLEAAYLAHLEHPTSTKILDILRYQIGAEFPFSGMSRYFVRQVWKIPGL